MIWDEASDWKIREFLEEDLSSVDLNESKSLKFFVKMCM